MANRTVGVRDAERYYDIYQFENTTRGVPSTTSSSAGEVNVDLKIGSDFYPKQLGVALDTSDVTDYIEVFVVDRSGNLVRQLIFGDYLGTKIFTEDFADLRDHIPSKVFAGGNTLRIVFHNVSGTNYTQILVSWEVWVPTGT